MLEALQQAIRAPPAAQLCAATPSHPLPWLQNRRGVEFGHRAVQRFAQMTPAAAQVGPGDGAWPNATGGVVLLALEP